MTLNDKRLQIIRQRVLLVHIPGIRYNGGTWGNRKTERAFQQAKRRHFTWNPVQPRAVQPVLAAVSCHKAGTSIICPAAAASAGMHTFFTALRQHTRFSVQTTRK